MKNYIIITANNESELMTYVNKRIGEGYSCQGGVSVSQAMTNSYHQTIFAQAMIYSPYIVSTLEEMIPAYSGVE